MSKLKVILKKQELSWIWGWRILEKFVVLRQAEKADAKVFVA